MTWQPIETAPKDGRRFLAYDPSLFGVCIAEWANGGWYVNQESQDGFGFHHLPLTYWMPLPEPPDRKP